MIINLMVYNLYDLGLMCVSDGAIIICVLKKFHLFMVFKSLESVIEVTSKCKSDTFIMS